MSVPDRLDSWKEIAAYLQRDVRTVQRWEALEGLPVHRHQHKKRGSVYALREELDRWRESRRAELFEVTDVASPASDATAAPEEPSRRAWLWTVIAAAAVVAAVVTLIRNPGGPVVSATPKGARDVMRLFGEALREGGGVERIEVGAHVRGLQLSPDGTTLYALVCDPGVTTIGVRAIDIRSRSEKWRVDHGGPCANLLQDAAGRRLFTTDGPDILIIDTVSRAIRRVSTPAATIYDFVLAKDDRTLYAAGLFKGLLAIDTIAATATTINPLPCPTNLALTPDGGRLYVNYQCAGPGGSPGHDAIDVIDTRTQKSMATITGLPNVGSDIAVSADGTQVWADGLDACRTASYDHKGCPGFGGVVNVIRTIDHMLVRSLRLEPPGEYNVEVIMTPDPGRVVLSRSRTLSINTATLRPVEASPIPIGRVVFSRAGDIAYAALGDGRAIHLLPLKAYPAPPASMTARWTMDGVVADLVAENDFAAVDDAAFRPGRIGLALNVAGAPPLRIERPRNFSIDYGMVTAMAWIKIEDSPPDAPMTLLEYSAYDARGATGWRLSRAPDGRIAVCLGFVSADCSEPGSLMVQSGQRVLPGGWHHVAFVRDYESVSLVIDGKVDGTGRFHPNVLDGDNLWFRIGSDEHGMPSLRGLIDEVEIYNAPLGTDEIAKRMR